MTTLDRARYSPDPWMNRNAGAWFPSCFTVLLLMKWVVEGSRHKIMFRACILSKGAKHYGCAVSLFTPAQLSSVVITEE